MRAEILSVGTELLLGHISDTNATYLARQLAMLGIDLYYVSQIGDNLERVQETLRRARDRSDLVVITGGLGPTEDDLTREAIARVLGETPEVRPDLEADLRAFFATRGIAMPARNLKQAWVLPSAQPLPNPHGTAPGWWAERDGRIIVAMPGVPHEMRPMWEEHVVPRLRPRTGAVLFTRVLRVYGLGESTVEQRLDPVLHAANPTVATYAKRDAVDVRVTAKAATVAAAEAQVGEVATRIYSALGEHIFGENEATLQQVALEALSERGYSLAVMESCTGGLLASLLTDVAGCSSVLRGGIVSYATEVKAQHGVPEEIIARHGVVSVETARAMARAVREHLHADVGIGITGVAGPDEQEGKPVGTVHIAVALPQGGADTSQHFHGARTEVKWRAALTALDLLRRTLLHQRPPV